MQDLSAALAAAIELVLTLDPDFVEIVLRSLFVSVTATAAAAVIGMPLGAAVVVFRFPGRHALTVLLNAFMGLPPVVVGLFVYIMLSRSGPLGVFGLLFTPWAMIIAQTILITPIIAALTRQTIEDLWSVHAEPLRSLGAGPGRALPTLLWEGRFALVTAVLAGFGRAVAEVGAVMIVGGNIDHVTRVMTTAIVLETGKGNLPLALGLGFLLILLSLCVNGGAYLIREVTQGWPR